MEIGRLKLPMGELNKECCVASYRLHRAYQGEPIWAMVTRNEQRSAIQLRDFSITNIETVEISSGVVNVSPCTMSTIWRFVSAGGQTSRL